MLESEILELTNVYQSGLASVSAIERLDTSDQDFLPPEIRNKREWVDALYRNRDHLTIIKGRYSWPEQFNLTVFDAAIAQANNRLNILKG
jgi:hypothetical protein